MHLERHSFILYHFLPGSTELPASSYSEQDRVLKAISLSYFIYGCETCAQLSGTVSELLDHNQMGIVIENFGIKRTDKADSTSAVFDSSEFIRAYIGNFRFLTYLKNKKSSFYGAAFCDDENKCVWISYSGAVSLKDIMACAELVLAPGLSSQEKSAIELYETVMGSNEVKNQSYTVMLTGHSLGGALASMVSRMSGCTAVTINGADGVAIDKINDILGESPAEYQVTNYMTSPKSRNFSLMEMVQRLMFLGSYRAVNYRVYAENGLTTDTHSVFSFIRFSKGDFTIPDFPDSIENK